MKQIERSDLEKLSHRKQVQFAIFCAKQVIHLVKPEHKKVCETAIHTAELFLEGKATKEDCRNAAANAANAAYAAAAAAYAAAANAAAYAANAAAYAAYAAAYAAAAAAHAAKKDKNKIIKDQWTYYEELSKENSVRFIEET